MLERIRQSTALQWLTIAGLILALYITYSIVMAIVHSGKIKVTVNVLPQNSKITLNGKPAGKTLYLSPGNYTFAASADGWKTDTQKVAINKSAHDVYLLPIPESQQARDLVKNNSKFQAEREELGGDRFNLQNQQALQKHPILKYLPYTQSTPPFSIDYGLTDGVNGDLKLVISNSSPNGREAAIDWIRQHGEDPTNMNIVFQDFSNPLGPELEGGIR